MNSIKKYFKPSNTNESYPEQVRENSILNIQNEQETDASVSAPAPFSVAANTESILNRIVRDPSLQEQFFSGIKPIQPVLDVFPTLNERKFQRCWYDLYDWLEYSVLTGNVFCFFCRLFPGKNHVSVDKFASKGFSNFRKALESFKKHNDSSNHKHARLAFDNRAKENPSCLAMLDSKHAMEVQLDSLIVTSHYSI